jgi:hypothetical protein
VGVIPAAGSTEEGEPLLYVNRTWGVRRWGCSRSPQPPRSSIWIGLLTPRATRLVVLANVVLLGLRSRCSRTSSTAGCRNRW